MIEYIGIRDKDAMERWRQAFEREHINRPDDYFERCLQENLDGKRVSLLAFVDGEVAGCCHLKYESDYPPFLEQHIPEINDLNVFAAYQRRGVGNGFLEQFEAIVRTERGIIGIGVGLYRDYGQAQRLYCRRGYMLDGRGLIYQNKDVEPGASIRVDDDLNLYFTKQL